MTLSDIISNLPDDIVSAWFPKKGRKVIDYGADEVLAGMEKIGRKINPDFIIDKNNSFAYRNVARWLIGDSSMQAMSATDNSPVEGDICKGLYLAGGVGTGKTTLMHIARFFSYILGSAIVNGSEEEKINLKPIHATDICAAYSMSGEISTYKTAPVLFVQDLGNEPTEVVYMGNRIAVMKTIIELRSDLDMMMCFTSNLNPTKDDFMKKYGSRVASRIGEMCNYLYLGGKDRRTRI